MPFTPTASHIWFDQQGAGEDVLLVAGLPGAGEDWDALIPRGAAALPAHAGIRLTRPRAGDLPRHGAFVLGL